VIVFDFKQGSPEWLAIRTGIPTASRFGNILTAKTRKPSASAARYMCDLIAERIIGSPVDTASSEFMLRGSAMESEAVSAYEFEHDCECREVGFVMDDSRRWGCSPDRLGGGGGLLGGSALAARALAPHCRVVGVEPEAGNDTQLSLARGEIVHIETPKTIADGAQTQHSGKLTFPVIQALVKGILTVSDAQLVSTMRFFAERMKMIVEPTGCLGAAALLEGAIDLRGQRVGIIISGGNVDLASYAALLA